MVVAQWESNSKFCRVAEDGAGDDGQRRSGSVFGSRRELEEKGPQENDGGGGATCPADDGEKS